MLVAQAFSNPEWEMALVCFLLVTPNVPQSEPKLRHLLRTEALAKQPSLLEAVSGPAAHTWTD